jgi:hypothetical protein
MGALTLAQLLESAQDKGLELDLEVSSAENQVLLDSIEKMSLEAIPKSVRRGIDELVNLNICGCLFSLFLFSFVNCF